MRLRFSRVSVLLSSRLPRLFNSKLALTLFPFHQKILAPLRRKTPSLFTPTMEGGDIVEPPQKRIKTDNASSTGETAPPAKDTGDGQLSKEIEVGITQFVTSGETGFTGILKKR